MSGQRSNELRAIGMVWRREMIVFFRNKPRIVIALVQPLLYFYALGTGLSRLTGAQTGSVSFRTFIFPGVLALTLLTPALFAAGSVVFDREFGFMREMLVAPVKRSSIVIGKCLGGATVATSQGVVLLAMAGVANVPYDPLMLLGLLAMMMLLAFTLVSFGVMFSARITSFQTFQAVIQIVLFPMLFLSGAIYPVHNLPAWLGVLNRLDPLTYAVDPMRRLVFSHLDVNSAALNAYGSGVDLFGWRVPTGAELAIVAALGLIALTIAIVEFESME